MALYRDSLAASNVAPAVAEECLRWTGMLRMVYAAPTDEQALEELDQPFLDYWRLQSLVNTADRGEEGAARPEPEFGWADRKKYLDRVMIYGSPDTCAAQIRQYAETGAGQMMLWFTWGFNDPALVRRSFRLFVNEVMPRF